MVDHLSDEALEAYGEPAEAAPVDENPVVEDPAAGDLEAVETEAPSEAAPAAAAPVAEDPWEAYGGKSRVDDAVAIADALGSEEGIESLVREGLVALGLDPDAAFSLAKGEEPPDPDELLTRADFEKERAKDRQTFAEQVRAQHEVVARGAVQGALSDLGVDDQDTERMVLTYAQNHVSGPQEMDPQKLVAAVQAGYKDYEAAMERVAQKYVQTRKQKNDTVPRPVKGGGAPANEAAPEPEPKNMEEARAAVRRAFPGAFNRD
jgi:hypothetical protein